MDNKKWLSQTLSEKYENQKKLYLGQTVRIGDSESGEGREHINKRRKGKIVGLYRNHFLVEFGEVNKHRESFNYTDIVTSITNYADHKNRGGEKLFSAKFGKEYKRIELEMIPLRINLESEILVPKEERKKNNERNYRNWTIEQVEYIMKNKDNRSREELANNFNKKFGTKATRYQITAVIHRENEREKV